MNADTLHDVDALYLQMFQQNLVAELRRARFYLQLHLKQSESLAMANELPPGFRKKYAEISERLLQLADAFGNMEDDLNSSDLSLQRVSQLDEWERLDVAPEEIGEMIDWLDDTEIEILDVLSNVGERLATLPRSIVSWGDCGLFSVHVELKRLAERPCYHLDAPIDIRSQPDFCADYFARKNYDRSQSGQWPHYLLDELLPLTLLPLIERLWIEMDAHGEGYTSRPTQKEDSFGKLLGENRI